MSDATHSAGPWTITKFEDHEDGGGEPFFRIDADSTLLLNVHACADGYVPGQNEANAYLLWASPQLLDRLTVLVAAVERGEVLDHHIRSAKVAIDRAKGIGVSA